MSKDSQRQQFFRATGNKTAALLLEYLMALREMKRKRHPDEPDSSPKLWLDFTQDALAEHFLVHKSTIRRAIDCLVAKSFCSVFQMGYDRTSRFELNLQAIRTAWESLPLFEDEAVSHVSTMNTSMCSQWTHACVHHEHIEVSTTDTCIPSSPSLNPSSPSSSPVVAEIQNENPEKQAPPEPDDDKDQLIQAYRESGFAKETTEFYLTAHSRQKLRAVLECFVEKKRRGKEVGTGLLVSWLHNPGMAGLEMDAQGCWRPAVELAREAKRRHQARDRPQLKYSESELERRSAVLAWESLDFHQQQQIRQQVETNHPTENGMQRMSRCHKAALALIHERSAP